MRRLLIAIGAVAVEAACSSSTDGDACGDIAGNWDVSSVRTSGNCPAELDGDGKTNMSISKGADGKYSLGAPGATGGCPANFDTATCKLTANCAVTNGAGQTVATIDFDYKFSGSTFTGTTINAARPPLVATTCSATYKDDGKKL